MRVNSGDEPEGIDLQPLQPDGTADDKPSNSRLEREERLETSVDEELMMDRDVEIAFNVTDRDLHEAKAIADTMTLDEVKALMEKVLLVHGSDPNFPFPIITKIKEFLGNDDVFAAPEHHGDLIYEMKLEAALITNNSPYAEVRSVVDNHDDPSMPSSTIRVWVIGLVFSAVMAFVNQLFSIRQPSIGLSSNVAQLLAFPIGKAAEYTLPDWGFTLFGTRHSLNPGPFSKKEHMLITIMGTVAGNTPYTANIIWIQYLPRFFNQPYAGQFSYQILVALSTNFVGYGMAGLTRRFLVYPAYCVWPASLSTIALNAAFHSKENQFVDGPFGKIFHISRYRFFLIACGAMFFYFFIPNYLFLATSVFSWMTWIAPNNIHLSAITGFNSGLGINPLSTFDYNVATGNSPDPLMVPFFATFNNFMGMLCSVPLVLGLWYGNAWGTSYLPINANHVFDNTGSPYNVSMAVNEKGLFDAEKYASYSPAYLSAAHLTVYMFFFAVYPATIVYVLLNHRYEVISGFKNLFRSFQKKKGSQANAEYQDVHNTLMAKYPEAPEWWYMTLLVTAVACGLGGITGYETYTTAGVIFYGLALCVIFVIPFGIIKAITGVEVGLNVLAEFIGGAWVAGNALAMNYFKTYGYVTCAHTLSFANDLKLAHYVKIPPRHTFAAQVVATLLSTFICTAVLNFQMNQIPNVCTEQAPNKMTCPGINTFFTASVLWGTIGPTKIFGSGGQYTALMAGWPIGVAIPLILWCLRRRYPATSWLRQVHPVLLLNGACTWAPYSMSYTFPGVWISWLSWIWCKNRFLEFWSKYNFVLASALGAGISLSGIFVFFALQYQDVELNWWGNEVPYMGCEGQPCPLRTLAPGEHFGPGVGQFH